MLISLQGKNDVYEFDPNHEADVITTDSKFSCLYRGRCVSSGKTVTIKHLLDSTSINGVQHEELIRDILFSLNILHHGIVQTLDVIVTQQGYFVVREYLCGVDLKTLTFHSDHPHLRNPIFLLRIASQVCEILAVLHAHGVIHRDIKPSNIFIETDEFGRVDEQNFNVKLLDFERAQIQGHSIFVSKKIPFAIVYSPPEQVLRYANLINTTVDLYSLGICIYESFAREPAFYHENQDLVLNMQVAHPLIKIPRVPKTLFKLLLKATNKHKFPIPPSRYKPEQLEFFLTKSRDERFQSALEMKHAIDFVIDEMILKQAKLKPSNFFKRLLGKNKFCIGNKFIAKYNF